MRNCGLCATVIEAISCACVCERESEGESECVCLCMYVCVCLWQCILSSGDCRRQPDGYRIILQRLHCLRSSSSSSSSSFTLPYCLAASQQNYHSKNTHTHTPALNTHRCRSKCSHMQAYAHSLHEKHDLRQKKKKKKCSV